VSVVKLRRSWVKLPPRLCPCSLPEVTALFKELQKPACPNDSSAPAVPRCGHGKVAYTLPLPIVPWPINQGGAKWPGKPQQLRLKHGWDQQVGVEHQKTVVNTSDNTFELNCRVWAGFFFSPETTCTCTHIQRKNSYLRRQQKLKTTFQCK